MRREDPHPLPEEEEPEELEIDGEKYTKNSPLRKLRVALKLYGLPRREPWWLEIFCFGVNGLSSLGDLPETQEIHRRQRQGETHMPYSCAPFHHVHVTWQDSVVSVLIRTAAETTAGSFVPEDKGRGPWDPPGGSHSSLPLHGSGAALAAGASQRGS